MPSLHPLDAALNLPPERSSDGVRQRVAVEVVTTSFDDVVATVATTSGAHMPKRQAEQRVVCAAQDLAAFSETRRGASLTEAQSTSDALVISVDGKGVPMRQADLRKQTRQAAAAQQPSCQPQPFYPPAIRGKYEENIRNMGSFRGWEFLES